MMRTLLLLLIAVITAQPALAATLRVPQDHKTIQAAIDASSTGDTIMVAPGKYPERIRLKPGIMLRSLGDDARRTDGLKRAEATIIVKDSQKPAPIYGNTASSADPKAKVVDVQGPSGIVEANVLK
jgi:pectin methylesterase-like acyl-CoA thioesterase